MGRAIKYILEETEIRIIFFFYFFYLT